MKPRLTVCSNRGPVEYSGTGGELQAHPAGPGGLVPLVRPALEHLGGRWICAAGSPADREAAARWPRGTDHGRIRLQLIELPEELHEGHYRVMSNGVLKPLFHYLLDLASEPSAELGSAWESYRAVNEGFADVLAADPPDGPLLIQDYHLMLMGAELRRRGLDAGSTHYFHHVPWCEPDYFGVLPGRLRSELLTALLSHDTVAFHSARWARAFGRCCQTYLPRAEFADSSVSLDARVVPVVVAPGTIDAAETAAAARAPAAVEWHDRIAARAAGRWTLVRVDRIDAWKNQLRGFLAFEELLRRRPEYGERAWFLATLTRSRTATARERAYEDACLETVRRINARARNRSAEPVTVLLNEDPAADDRARSLGALRAADAVLVNPLYDGMNLVAKEAVAVTDRDAVLILSRNAGAHDELGAAALGINPFDVTETAAAIETAIELAAPERRSRASVLRAAVEAHTPEDWVRLQLDT